IDVWPLFAVHLYRDEVVVQNLCGRRVLEALVLHDVAPVARRVADAEEDRLILRLGRRERLVPPRVPVHRIAGMLAEVEARLRHKAVHTGIVPFATRRGRVYDASRTESTI